MCQINYFFSMETPKLLLNTTLDEFVFALTQALGNASFNNNEEVASGKVTKHYVYGYAGLCKLLGCSKTTAVNIKKSGVLDPAISQHGKIIVIDADLALSLINVRKTAKRFAR